MKNTFLFSVIASLAIINGLFSSNTHEMNQVYLIGIQRDTSIEDVPVKMELHPANKELKDSDLNNYPCNESQYFDNHIYSSEDNIIIDDNQFDNNSLFRFLAQNIKYPANARNNNIKGKVILQLLIDECGYIKESKVLSGIGYGCDEEAIRLTKIMPRWYSAKKAGKRVKSYYVLPISFKLL